MKNPVWNIRGAMRCLAAVILVAVQAAAWAAIEPYPKLGETAADLVDKLESRHYSRRGFDDALSSMLLDAYLDRLDPSRLFLYRGDVEEFEHLRHNLDDQWRGGEVAAGFAMFNRYHERTLARLDWLLEELPELVENFDFTRDESLSLEPESLGWPADEAEADERWRKQIKNATLGLMLAGKSREEVLPSLERRYRNQRDRVAQFNAQDVFQIYANSLTELYDPHTNYLSPRTLENFNINMSLSLEGIGAVLQSEDEYTKVVRIVPAGPADKQGELQPSDRILGVAQGEDGEFEDVIGWRLDEVVQLIRGPKDTIVRLDVQPADAKTPDERKVITIVRNKVKLEEQSAQGDIIEVEHGEETLRIGLIDIPTFYADFEAMRRGDPDFKSTTRDVRRLLDEHVEAGVDGILIDLRGNGGGSLQEANDLTGLFIEYGPTVQIRHASQRVIPDGKRTSTPYYDGPLVVLIDRLSASASEIFTGAIQDYQRGIVVGSQSFGKGTVQVLLPLAEGQLKLTESKFYRISGDSTQHRGVVPDVKFPSRHDAGEIGESSLDHALGWDRIRPLRYQKYHDIDALAPYLEDIHHSRVESDPDFAYLRDSLALAESNAALDSITLNEQSRIALRDERKARALAIENKRRDAKGLPLLDSLDDDSDEDNDTDTDTDIADINAVDIDNNDDETSEDVAAAGDTVSDTVGEDMEEEEERDVLLEESANILVDAFISKNGRLLSQRQENEAAP